MSVYTATVTWKRSASAFLKAGFAAAGLACALFGFVAPAQGQAAQGVTHVVCVTNETGEALTLWIKETPEAPGPRAGFGAVNDGTPHCYRRVATQGRDASVAISEALEAGNIQTAAGIQRVAAQMQALSDLPSACEISAALVEQANVEQRRAVLLRVFKGASGNTCAASAGPAPTGAAGLQVFETTRTGATPTYYESAERVSFPLCVINQSHREIAAWPQARPALPEHFLPRENVTRASDEMPWCSRYWLPTGSAVSVALGGIRARQVPDSPDFTDACAIGADLIDSARAGERTGIVVRVTRQRGQLLCVAAVEPAPARGLGLGAFNPPQVGEPRP